MIISVVGTVGSARSRSSAPAVAAPPPWAVSGTVPSVAGTSVNHQESRNLSLDSLRFTFRSYLNQGETPYVFINELVYVMYHPI